MRTALAPALACAALAVGVGCFSPASAAGPLPAPKTDLPVERPRAGAPPPSQTAVFAAGCFWCVEALFEQVDGVTDVVSGYAGGTPESATYDKVSGGETGHAEAVRVTFDPSRVTYGQLLRVFFTLHDPTTKDRQGPDWGRQYRSAIFHRTPEERAVAEAYIRQLGEARAFERPIVTTLEPLTAFHAAEPYHQDFVRLHPAHPYVAAWLPAKAKKLREQLGPLLKR